jgi:hypothetical protein
MTITMDPLPTTRTVLFILLMVTAAGADKAPNYQSGTITKNFSGSHKSYDLKTASQLYQINNCGDFQTGQTVDFRVEDLKIYILRENGKEQKCAIEARSVGSSADSTTENTPPAPKYQQGTITGWTTRMDSRVFGGANNTSVMSNNRRTRVYELKGTDLVYQIDDCGSFQAGQFTAGQAVDYRVDDADKNDKRIYIRRDNGKDYKCRLEGAKAVEGAKAGTPSTTP